MQCSHTFTISDYLSESIVHNPNISLVRHSPTLGKNLPIIQLWRSFLIKNIFCISGSSLSWPPKHFVYWELKPKLLFFFFCFGFAPQKFFSCLILSWNIQNHSLTKVKMTHFERLKAPACLWDLSVHKWHQQNSLGKAWFCKTQPLLPLMILHRAWGSQFAQLVALSTGNTGFPNQCI